MGGAEECRGHVQVSFIPRGCFFGLWFLICKMEEKPRPPPNWSIQWPEGRRWLFLKNYLFIYLVVPGLSCSMQYLRSLLRRAGSLVEARGI